MRIGYFPVMAGRKAGGVETFQVELLRGLAAIDRGNQYHVSCTEGAIDASGIGQANFHFHLLRPRWRPILSRVHARRHPPARPPWPAADAHGSSAAG